MLPVEYPLLSYCYFGVFNQQQLHQNMGKFRENTTIWVAYVLQGPR